ncbi:retroviral-like aspartic protease, partial [Mycobacterium tuberculosis]|nr:retroviral-like aspartic protease [Mycobacterium tuberculosis]
LVEQLNLALFPRPNPYRLQWLDVDGDLQVDHQVEVRFSIGKFKDKVLCDVIPMEACHILLGRPWQFDHKTLLAA